ncbi:hypothetical protein ABPG73_012383 [Tetrahymena malaccensis]
MIDYLNVQENVFYNDDNKLNFEIKSQGKYDFTQSISSTNDPTHFILHFFKNKKNYIFVKNENDSKIQVKQNDKLIKDNRLFSAMCCLYLYQNPTYHAFLPVYLKVCNHFMRVLKLNKIQGDLKIIKWRECKTNWDKTTQYKKYYLYCPANCQVNCDQCAYFFKEEELKNTFLPVEIKQNPQYLFDSILFWFAEQFDCLLQPIKFLQKYQIPTDTKDFLKEFYCNSPCKAIFLIERNINPFRFIQIQIQLLNCQKIKNLKSVLELYKVDISQIEVLNINLSQKDMPKDEKQRLKLYQFILSMQNLKSINIGLDHLQSLNANKKSQEDVTNFIIFMKQLKVENLQIDINHLNCQKSINQIFDCIGKYNTQLKSLKISFGEQNDYQIINSSLFQNIQKMKQIQVVYLNNFNMLKRIQNIKNQQLQIIKKCQKLCNLNIS